MQPTAQPTMEMAPSIPDMDEKPVQGGQDYTHNPSMNNMSMNTLPRVDSAADVVVPPLPSLFDGAQEEDESTKKLGMHHMTESTSSATIDELHVFDTPLEEHDFVSTILENTGESSNCLSVLS